MDIVKLTMIRGRDEAYNLRTQQKFSNNPTTNPQDNNNENVHSFNSGYRLNGANPFAVCCDVWAALAL